MNTHQARPPAPRPFTGRHMAAIMVGFFAVVIAVNLFMAREASATFGGVVVENSYVASQRFNRWLGEAEAGQALGWKVDLARRGDDRITVSLHGVDAGSIAVSAVARHPLGRQADVALRMLPDGMGSFVSTEPLPAGRWRLRVEVGTDGGKHWRSEGEVQ